MKDLPKIVIGVDVETTSLEAKEGEIIEVAAIKYDLKKGTVISEFTALCAPSSPLTEEITSITGITQDMVKNQPPFKEILPDLQEFIGHDTLFAHNAPFDVGFLSHHGLKLDPNPVWDTFMLAGIAWPEASSYNLGTISQDLNIQVEGEHRAGDDVRLTWELLLKSIEQLTLSKDTHKQAMMILDRAGLQHYQPLFTVTPSSLRGTEGDAAIPSSDHKIATLPPVARNDAKTTSSPLTKSSSDLLGPDGPLVKNIPGFEPRKEQQQMAATIDQAIDKHKLALIEALPGTGKTFGYLIPLLKSLHTRGPSEGAAIVSTHTKNLQDQLIEHDVPRLIKALDQHWKIAVLKGRRNYLCQSRLLQAAGRTHHKPEEAFLLVKLLAWIDHGGSGDLERFNASHQALHLLHHLHADALSCRHTCPKENPDCPYQVAKRNAQEADLVVINHALLVSYFADDASLHMTNVVIDEAHHLESVAREASSIDLSGHRLAEIIAPFIQFAKKTKSSQAARLQNESEDVINEFNQILNQLFNFTEQHGAGDKVLLTKSIRLSSDWKHISKATQIWQGRYQFMLGLIKAVAAEAPKEDSITDAVSEAGIFSKKFDQFISGEESRIQWLEIDEYRGKGELKIHDVSLSVNEDLRKLYHYAHSVTFTSATLTVNADYGYIKQRIGLKDEDLIEAKIGTPFNFQKQMMIYVVDDSPYPNDPNYEKYISDQLITLSHLTSGRLLGLFTSHQAVRNAYYGALKGLNKAKIRLMAQKVTGGRHNLIRRFKNEESSVLLGTNSLWEGIDVPGPHLSSIMIAKLPFVPPNDPIINSIGESEKINAFTNLSVPQMILRMRQGIGRLIRDKNDFGAIVILDGRFLKQSYGDQVLKSLPPATIHIGSHQDLTRILTDWYGEARLQKWAAQLEKK